MKHFTIFISLILIGCKPAAPNSSPTAGKPRVAVVNYPLAYFVERIAGDLVEVHFPEIEGDPAFWKPSADDIRAFQSADLILRNGAGYAKWAAHASLPRAKTVNTGAAFADRLIEVTDHTTHQHGKDGEHSHAGTAFTTWMDLDHARKQAAATHEALANLLPAQRGRLATQFAALERDLTALDTQLRGIAADWGETPLLGSHPVYQYLARRYGLQIRSVHWEPEVMPDAAGWAELEALRQTHPAKLMLWEDTPDQAIAAKLKAQGIRSIVFAPCGGRMEGTDWLKRMRANAAALRTAR